jgi:hypothetical protein
MRSLARIFFRETDGVHGQIEAESFLLPASCYFEYLLKKPAEYFP